MEPNAKDLMQQGIAALQAGDKTTARHLFMRAADILPRNQNIWLWLSDTLESVAEQRACLEQVVALNPDSAAGTMAQQKLERLPTPPPPPLEQRPRRAETLPLPPEEPSGWPVGPSPHWQETEELPWEERPDTDWEDKPLSWQERLAWLKQPHPPLFWVGIGVASVLVLLFFVAGMAYALFGGRLVGQSGQPGETPTGGAPIATETTYPDPSKSIVAAPSPALPQPTTPPAFNPGGVPGQQPYPSPGPAPTLAPVVPPGRATPPGFYPGPGAPGTFPTALPTSPAPPSPTPTPSQLAPTLAPTAELPTAPIATPTADVPGIPPATPTAEVPDVPTETTDVPPPLEEPDTPAPGAQTALRGTPVPTPYSEDVFVRSSRGVATEDGSYTIVGEVLNNTSNPIWFITVNGSVYDTANNLLLASSVEIIPPRADPQERAGFKLTFDGVTGVARYDLQVQYETEMPLEEYRVLTILAQDADTTFAPELEITGELRNDTDRPVEVTEVIATLYDAENEVLDVLTDGLADQPTLAPGESTTYSVFTMSAPEFSVVQVRTQGRVVQ